MRAKGFEREGIVSSQSAHHARLGERVKRLRGRPIYTAFCYQSENLPQVYGPSTRYSRALQGLFDPPA